MMAPSSPGWTRLLLALVLVLLASLCVYTVWNSRLHYRYVSVNSIAHQDLSSHSYGVVIDAGSSSSKVHLFHWPPHNGDPHTLLDINPLTDEYGDPLSKKVEPGIATFATRETAFNSLIPLLGYASTHIPTHKHSETVLYVMGTAGMRLLSTESQDSMMAYFTTTLNNEYPFHLPKDGIQVISGELEGVFSWITINYLLGHFSPESHSQSGTDSSVYNIHTVGVMDMGGASLQIAFEVQEQAEVNSEDVVEINLGCGIGDKAHKHRVYTRTYLGYGSNTVREKYYYKLAKSHLKALNSSWQNQTSVTRKKYPVIWDPCTQHGLTENVTVNKASVLVKGLGDFSACKASLIRILEDKSDNSNNTGSTVGQGFDRPPSKLEYTSLEYYGTSEFWYTMRDVLRMGGAYSAAEFEAKSSEFCRSEWRLVSERFSKQLYTYADYNRLKSQCLKSSWLSVVLHDALDLPTSSLSLRTASIIRGQSVQWPLGALLYYTRFLPLREVQLQQFKSTQPTHWELSRVANSSVALPLLVVLSVVILLLVCRHRHSSPLLSPGSNLRFPRTFSKASSLMTHRRSSSVARPAIDTNTKLSWIV